MVDTNILVSAIIFPNNLMGALFSKIIEEHHLVLSTTILDEFKKVVRQKFIEKLYLVEISLNKIPYDLVFHELESPKKDLFEIRDKSDYPILCSAIDLDVDVFITGDKDFRNVKLERPEILTAAGFLNKY
jgi:putative PIN family toxin of toxin-antitoxin system